MVKTSDLNSLRGPSQHCIRSAVETLGVEVPQSVAYFCLGLRCSGLLNSLLVVLPHISLCSILGHPDISQLVQMVQVRVLRNLKLDPGRVVLMDNNPI